MKNQKILSFFLSFISGYTDTAVFVYMGGLFVAHVTGNFVLLGTAVSGQPIGGEHAGVVTLQLLSFPVFVAAAALAAGISKRAGGGQAGTRMLFAIVAGLFALVSVGAFTGWDIRIAASLLLVVAMALLNAAHRLNPTLGPPFTVMTGNVTGLAVGLAQLIGIGPKDPGEGKIKASALVVPTFPIAGFLLGCASGALAQAVLGFGAMVVPFLLLLGALFTAV